MFTTLMVILNQEFFRVLWSSNIYIYIYIYSVVPYASV
jgi:hypothetical protein